MLARPARRATYHRSLRSGELLPQNERELRRSEGSSMLIGDPLVRGAMSSQTLRRSEGSGMLIGDPLGEGSNASSTNSELWEVEDSSFSAQKGAACS